MEKIWAVTIPIPISGIFYGYDRPIGQSQFIKWKQLVLPQVMQIVFSHSYLEDTKKKRLLALFSSRIFHVRLELRVSCGVRFRVKFGVYDTHFGTPIQLMQLLKQYIIGFLKLINISFG
jgi:hypothetical protein